MLPAFLHAISDWPVRDIVIVDGGSQDQTPTILRAWGTDATIPAKRYLIAKKGRGSQMNAGAQIATGDLLLFLHSDTMLPPLAEAGPPPVAWFEEISEKLRDPGVVGGAFRLKIDSPSFFLKIVEGMANLRSTRFGLPYGDQGIFVRSDIFRKMGGYRDWPLMEDVAFIQSLKQFGKIVLLKAEMTTSARRWERGTATSARGIVISLRNIILLFLYFIGVSPTRLARWYN